MASVARRFAGLPARSGPSGGAAAQLARDLAMTDLTDPSDGPHAIQLLVEAAVTALTSARVRA